MAISVGELVGTLSLKDDFSAAVKKAGQEVDAAGISFNKLAALAAVATGAIAATTAAFVKLGSHGADVADVQDAFSNLSQRIGSTADVMLNQLQRGTLGTITNFELMKMANAALGAGLVRSADEMGVLAAGAKLLADRTGKDAAEAFETLTKAMATGRTAGLKQMGLFVDTKGAVDAYKESLQDTGDKMSDLEGKMVSGQAILASLRQELESNGVQTADFADNVARAQVSVQNFVDNLGVAIARSPVIQAAMEAMGQAIQAAFGENQQQQIRALMGYVNSFAIFLTDVGQVAIAAAKYVAISFTEAKVVLNTVLEVLAQGIAKAAGFIARLYEEAAALPGVGEALGVIGVGFRDLADQAALLALNWGDLATQQEESIAKQMAGFDQMARGLDGVQANMLKARDAAIQLGTAVPPPIGLQNWSSAATQMAIDVEGAVQRARVAMADEEAMAAAMQQRHTDTHVIQVRARDKVSSEASEAERKRTQQEALWAAQKYDIIASSASSILQSVFGKSKAAAIAGAIIDTYAAIAKTLAAYPWPWSLIPAAAAAAAGFAQVNAIRSQQAGFAEGTPGTSFIDFGRESAVTLHGREAVINESQGQTLADMLMAGRDETAAETRAVAYAIERLREEQRAQRAALPIMLRDAVMLARA